MQHRPTQAKGEQKGIPQSAAACKAEEIIGSLVEMGYTREQAIEAAKRGSSVEAAVEWILMNCS